MPQLKKFMMRKMTVDSIDEGFNQRSVVDLKEYVEYTGMTEDGSTSSLQSCKKIILLMSSFICPKSPSLRVFANFIFAPGLLESLSVEV